jgi:endonuclease/exonuclease/phosphatase family metal-dependent hydrolase
VRPYSALLRLSHSAPSHPAPAHPGPSHLRIIRLSLFVLCSLASGCLRPHPALPEPAGAARCQGVIDETGTVSSVEIRWHRPDDLAERRALRSWCDAAGPAVVIAQPADPHVTASPRGDLVIVDWNAHVGGGDLAGLVAALRRGALTGGQPVGNFVVLLQEVFRASPRVPASFSGEGFANRIEEHPPTGDRRDIVSLARELGLSLYYAPSMRNGREARNGISEDRGNAILSTLPLSSFALIELPFERQRRVGISAVISGIGSNGAPWTLRVASSHLDATAGARHLRLFASGLRARQALSLTAALGDDVPTVLGSDLNTWWSGPSEPAYRELRRLFAQTDPSPMQTTLRAGRILDYIFYRLPPTWRGESRRLNDRFGSDHFPLLGRIETGSWGS